MKPTQAALMLALMMGAVGVDNAAQRTGNAKPPRRFTAERKAAAEAKRAAAHHGGNHG